MMSQALRIGFKSASTTSASKLVLLFVWDVVVLENVRFHVVVLGKPEIAKNAGKYFPV